jgi:CheY-like chemotaxis protein
MARAVLIVDDHAENLELLAAYLSKLDLDVRFASDGNSALEDVAGRAPDLVLLDIEMPGLDGIEVCRRIKADPVTRLAVDWSAGELLQFCTCRIQSAWRSSDRTSADTCGASNAASGCS